MKNAFILSFFLLPLVFVSGCKTTIQDGPTKVVVQDGQGGHPHDDGFCPPGQAKKGNC